MVDNFGNYSSENQVFNYQFNFGQSPVDGEAVTVEEAEVTIDQMLDGEDRISTYNLNPYSFSSTSNPDSYITTANRPLLFDPDKSSGDSVDPAFVKGVKILFMQYAEKALINAGVKPESLQALIIYMMNPDDYEIVNNQVTVNGVVLKADDLALANKVSDGVLQNVREDAGLPANWTLKSDAKDWKPLPPDPYTAEEREEIVQFFQEQLPQAAQAYIQQRTDLSPSDQEALMNAIKSGTPPSDPKLASHYEAIQQAVTQLTIETYGLSDTWVSTADINEASLWVPINAQALSPAIIQALRINMTVDNVLAMMNDIETIVNDFSTSAQAAVSAEFQAKKDVLVDYLKTIATALQNLKQHLYDMQIQDNLKTRDAIKAKFDAAQTNKQIAEAAKPKQEELSGKQKAMQTFAKIMPIVGAVISAITTVAAIAITVLTLGVATPAAIALAWVGITFGVSLMSYSIADAAMEGKLSQGLTQALGSALEWMSKGIADIIGEIIPMSESAKAALKTAMRAVIIVAMVVAIVALMVATCSGIGAAAQVGATAASSAASTAAVQITKTVAVQILTQVMLSTMMSPNGVSALATEIMLQTNPNASEDEKMKAKIIAMCMSMIVIMTATAAAGAGGFKNLASSAADSALGMAKSAYASAANSLSTLSKMTVEEAAKAGAMAIASAITDALKTLAYFATLGPVRSLYSFLKDANRYDWLLFLQGVGTYGPAIVNVVSGCIQGAIKLRVAEILKELGDIEAAQEEIKATIKMLEKIIANLQEGASSFPKDIRDVMGQIKKLFADADKALTNATEAFYIPGKG